MVFDVFMVIFKCTMAFILWRLFVIFEIVNYNFSVFIGIFACILLLGGVSLFTSLPKTLKKSGKIHQKKHDKYYH